MKMYKQLDLFTDADAEYRREVVDFCACYNDSLEAWLWTYGVPISRCTEIKQVLYQLLLQTRCSLATIPGDVLCKRLAWRAARYWLCKIEYKHWSKDQLLEGIQEIT